MTSLFFLFEHKQTIAEIHPILPSQQYATMYIVGNSVFHKAAIHSELKMMFDKQQIHWNKMEKMKNSISLEMSQV